MSVGQVFYTPWCDEHGKVIDDGTVCRLGEQAFRWTAADASLRWFRRNAAGMDVKVEDVSEAIAALALQGPTSAKLLRAVARVDIDRLKYFRVMGATIAGVSVDISRTGYTGGLGCGSGCRGALRSAVWDALMKAGSVRHQAGRHARARRRPHRSRPPADRSGFLQQPQGDDRVTDVYAV
jgi:aminomethyltransferase